MSTVELLLHPVRLRIVQTMLGRDTITTRELAALLPDVPAATLYRHVGTLVDGGVVRVVAEQPIRGAVERTLALDTARVSVNPDDPALDNPDAVRAGFLAFLGSLATAFDHYLDSPQPHLGRDLAGFRQLAFTATDDEWRTAIQAINDALVPLVTRTEHPEGARRRLFATVSVPADDRPAT